MLRFAAGINDCEVFSSEGDTPSPSFPDSGTIPDEATERVGGWGRLLWSCVLRAWTHCDDGYLTRPQIQQEWDFEKGFSLVFQAGFQLECNTLQVSYLFWSLASVWKISDVKSITVTWIYIFYTWTVLLQWILCVGYHCILTVVLNKIIFSKVVY